MGKKIATIRLLIPRIFIALLLLLLAAIPAIAQLTYEQQKALKDYFDQNAKFLSFGSKPFDLLKNQKYTKFFKQYSNALLVIRVANEIKETNDLEAVKMVIEELENRVIEKIAPAFSKVLGWIGWAKLGMELFKEFYADPALEQFNIDTYINKREAGWSPGESFATVRAWGHVREQALKRFRAEYGDLPFQKAPWWKGKSDRLLPEWEKKLEDFANAWFETQYQLKLLEDARKAFMQEKQRAEKALPEFDDYLVYLLEEGKEQEQETGKTYDEPSPSEEGPDIIVGVWKCPGPNHTARYTKTGHNTYQAIIIDPAGLEKYHFKAGEVLIKDLKYQDGKYVGMCKWRSTDESKEPWWQSITITLEGKDSFRAYNDLHVRVGK
jgi:hypothetical protein